MEIKHRNRKEREKQTCFLKTHQTETNAQQSKHLYKIPNPEEDQRGTWDYRPAGGQGWLQQWKKAWEKSSHRWALAISDTQLYSTDSHPHTAGQSHKLSLSLSLLAQHPVCAAPLAARPSLTSNKPAIPRLNTCQGNTTYKNCLLKDH